MFCIYCVCVCVRVRVYRMCKNDVVVSRIMYLAFDLLEISDEQLKLGMQNAVCY
jgi:hypothetical protein